jgi:UDP-GlcNAc:undecaprenyl-phosphate GlcNAc-1-phosphate transferase
VTPYLLVAAVAAVVSAGASVVVLRLSKRFNLAPDVRERDVHVHPTPRLGGIAMFVGVLAAFGFAYLQEDFSGLAARPAQVFAVLGACALIVVVGVLDDLLDLDWMVKLAVQLTAAGLLAWQGVQIVSLPLGDTLVVGSPIVNFALTVFLITLVMNAVNFIDGLDGLVAGVAIIANIAFFIYTRLLVAETGAADATSLASLIAAVLVGVCIGFLPFNWHRAKMFMGDTGALLIGLLMAVSTISVTGQLNPAALDQKVVLAGYIPIILPIAVLAVPLADFTLAVVRRVQAGKSPFSADRMHLHHRLLDMGHSHVQAVFIFYLGTAVTSLACLLVFTLQDFVIPGLVLGGGLLLCVLVTLFPRARLRTRAGLLTLSCHERAAQTTPDVTSPDERTSV